MRKTITVLAVVCMSLSTVSLHAAQSTFDTDAENWSMMRLWTFGNPPTGGPGYRFWWESTTGNPGGCIKLIEEAGSNDTFKAPAEYLGDKSSAFGMHLAFDLWTRRGTPSEQQLIALVGSSTTLYYTSAVNGDSWNHFQIPLVGSGWRKNHRTGPGATDADMLDVLGNVSALYIWGDFTAYGDENSRLDNVFMAEAPVGIDVEIDVKPGSFPNSINLRSKKGVTPVAILGSSDFDVTDVDPDTVELEGVAPVKWAIEDLALVPNPAYDPISNPDVPQMIGDGYDDLIFHLSTPGLRKDNGGTLDGDSIDATLTGETIDGTPIEGTDSVRIIKY